MTQMVGPPTGDSFANAAGTTSYVSDGKSVIEVAPADVAAALARGWSLSGEPGYVTAVATSAVTAPANAVQLANPTGGGFTVSLPAASAAEWVTVKKVDAGANAVTVAPNGADLIEGANSSQSISSAHGVLRLVSDGVSAWYAV